MLSISGASDISSSFKIENALKPFYLFPLIPRFIDNREEFYSLAESLLDKSDS